MNTTIERLNLMVPSNVLVKIKRTAKRRNVTTSELVRKAVVLYIKALEARETRKRLEEGYKNNYEYYQKQQELWEFAHKPPKR